MNVSMGLQESWDCYTGPEFLKAAIMQSHDRAKCFRICANFGLMNTKPEKLALISCICPNFTKKNKFYMFYVIFTHFMLKIFNQSTLIAQKNSLLANMHWPCRSDVSAALALQEPCECCTGPAGVM